MQVQATTADTAAETLAALLEQITTLNKTISSIQEDLNRWKKREQKFAAKEEEMYDTEDSFPASRSILVIDLVTDSTSNLREIPPFNEAEEATVLPPSPTPPRFVPASVHFPLNVASVGYLAQVSARPELGRKGPSVPQSSGENVSLPDLISDSSLNPCLEEIFVRPFLAIVSQPNLSNQKE